MRSEELFDAFREDVSDVAAPYLWSNSEVWRYMDDAYKMFIRLTGGVADSTSSITQIDIREGEADAEISPLILKIRDARLASNSRPLTLINYADIPANNRPDYGHIREIYLNKRPGEVRYMLIGQQRGLATWLQVPMVDDVAYLSVYRLPLETITGPEQEFSDIGGEHHEHLLLWMKARAYGKQDAETFDKGRRDEYKAAFTEYCSLAKSEWERAKSKVRVVTYGGL